MGGLVLKVLSLLTYVASNYARLQSLQTIQRLQQASDKTSN